MQWVEERTSIKQPAVVGAVIDLGNCCNLFEAGTLDSLKSTYESLIQVLKTSGASIPTNDPLKVSEDLLLRHLDCAVIQHMHRTRENAKMSEFNSVRGIFFEGNELYPNAGFKERNHIQLCVRNPNCIKGYFRVLKDNSKHPTV